ncbi:MAG: putative two-component system sensor kinase, partial [Actinomycetia bacterium]|nr:putative two-component system sensor kinase [Actinomycetes bacterium]
MLRDSARSLWAEPRVPDPPARVWRDWALVAGLVPVAVLEGVFREVLVWRIASIVVALALVPLLLWRRTHPLVVVVLAFGTLTVVDAAALFVGVDWRGLSANIFVLLFVYALFRWGSGRQGALGLAVVAVPVLLSAWDPQIHRQASEVPASNVTVGALVELLVAAVGVAVRYQDKARARGLDRVKLLEREQLARELHDTVAHHVSAIAIRAQAGRVVAASDPAAALDALAVIEEEASRTLAEMRAMVGALRQGEEADLSPQRGVADIERLTTVAGDRPHVDVELSGDLDGLRPSVDATLYRLAQESITNAVRHARHATRIEVRVHGEDDCVRLTVGDDGDAGAFDARSSAGFGLIGMAERAKLLGGTLDAGPNRNRGWT